MISRRNLILCFYIFIFSCFFNLALTGKALLGVNTIEDALNLLKMDQLFVVRFIKIFIDYKHSLPKLVIQLLGLIPLGTLLFSGLMGVYVLPYIKRKYALYITLIPFIFVMILVVVGVSLNSIDVKAALTYVRMLSYITLILSIGGLLMSLMIFITYSGQWIDVESDIDYNKEEGVSI